MVKIGLEIHGYLNTKEKLFCSCDAIHGAKFSKPNTNICPICTAQPGAKPMLPNATALKNAIKICLILNCKINEKFSWQRKHYDWPDLPKGDQSTISGKHASPVGIKGNFLGIRITEAHLEEDPASWNPLTGEVDYNKSGYPLIEIVTEPDFTSSEKVVSWIEELSSTLKYFKVINKNLGIKVDVNVSLPELKGARVEIKNINSLKNISAAINHEIQRQSKPSETPKSQETRMFDEVSGKTLKMRSKEIAEDYRFVSEPDLPVMNISKLMVKKVKSSLPEMPEEKVKKLVKDYKIEKRYAEILARKIDLVEFFEKIVIKTNPRLATHWVLGELLRILNYSKKEIDDPEINIKPEHFIELLELIENKKITELKAKEILNKFIPKSFSPKSEISQHEKISSKGEIEGLARKIIKENKSAVQDFKSGKKESLNFLIGQVMKSSNKRADYKTAREILENLLS